MQSRINQMSEYWVFYLVYSVFLFHSDTFAIIRLVPNEFSSIQTALDASGNLDTVRVLPGIYQEALRFPEANIRLLSNYIFTQDSADIFNTTVDASNSINDDTSAVITFVHSNTQNAQVSGFTLSNGSGTLVELLQIKRGGGVYIDGASPTISHNFFTQDSANAGAIYCINSSALFSHNLFYDNYCGGDWLCVIAGPGNSFPPVIFEWNEIQQNRVDEAASIVEIDYSHAIFRYNWFHDIILPSAVSTIILQSYAEFSGNIYERIIGDTYQQGIVILEQAVNPIQDNIFRDCSYGKYAITLQRNTLANTQEIHRNFFQNLTAFNEDNGAIMFITHPSIRMHENVFENCECGGGGNIRIMRAPEGIDAIINQNIFINNHTRTINRCSGIQIGPTSPTPDQGSCLVIDNIFQTNWPITVSQDHPDNTWDVSNNYWGHASGPYHPTKTLTDKGIQLM